MLMVDKATLKRRGWRSAGGRDFTYPRYPKDYTLKLTLRGKRVDEIFAEDKDGNEARVFCRTRGFRRSDARNLFSGRVAGQIEDAIEELHQAYIISA